MPRLPALTDLAHGPVECHYKGKTATLTAINVTPSCLHRYFVTTPTRPIGMWVERVDYFDPDYDDPNDEESCFCGACIATSRIDDYCVQTLSDEDCIDVLTRLVHLTLLRATKHRERFKASLRRVFRTC